MTNTSIKPESSADTVEFYLLGQVDFDACLALQRRLVYEASGADDRRVCVLMCEHTDLVTVRPGRLAGTTCGWPARN